MATTNELPDAELYERTIDYWPYHISVNHVIDKACELAPRRARVLDMMCGPGSILADIAARRPDLELVGVDIKPEFIEYGHAAYPRINLFCGDVLNWRASEPFDMVLCTGALHHLPFNRQPLGIRNLVRNLKRDGLSIISDCYVSPFTSERERRQAARELGDAYLQYAIEHDAPNDVIEWTIDILENDICGLEWKTHLNERLEHLCRMFSRVKTEHTWPVDKQYGDYVHICTL